MYNPLGCYIVKSIHQAIAYYKIDDNTLMTFLCLQHVNGNFNKPKESQYIYIWNIKATKICKQSINAQGKAMHSYMYIYCKWRINNVFLSNLRLLVDTYDLSAYMRNSSSLLCNPNAYSISSYLVVMIFKSRMRSMSVNIFQRGVLQDGARCFNHGRYITLTRNFTMHA